MGLRSFDLRHRPSDRRASVKPCRRVPARSYLLFPGKIVDAFYIDSSWWPNCIIHDIRFQRFFNIFPIWFETLVGISITRPILICHFLTVSCFCWAIMLGHRVHSLLLRYAVCTLGESSYLSLLATCLPSRPLRSKTVLSVVLFRMVLRCYMSLLSLFKPYIAW